MSFLNSYEVNNAGVDVTLYEYTCDRCDEYIHVSYPHWNEDEKNFHLCWHCAYVLHVISEEVFSSIGMYSKDENEYFSVLEIDGQEIISTTKRKIRFGKDKDKRGRFTTEYKIWRTKVFERDEYTCQVCNRVGGELNAHHIKSYKDYPKLRTDLDNGVTLCVECHRNVHKQSKKK